MSVSTAIIGATLQQALGLLLSEWFLVLRVTPRTPGMEQGKLATEYQALPLPETCTIIENARYLMILPSVSV